MWRLQRIAAGILVCISAAPARVAAQPGPGQFVVNTTVSGYQFGAATAMNASGKFAIVWSSEGPGGNEAIYLQRFNADGTHAGGQIRVDDPAYVPFFNSYKRDASVAMDATGNIFVVWTGGIITAGTQFDYTFSSSQIYGQRFDANGLPRGTNFLVNTRAYGSEPRQPSVAMYASGETVVVWSAFGPADGSSAGIFGQQFDSSGVKMGLSSAACPDYLGAPAVCDSLVNGYTPGLQWKPQVAAYPAPCSIPQGGIGCVLGPSMVVWEGSGPGGTAGVHGRLFDGHLMSPAGAQFRVNANTNAQQIPAVGMDGNGDVAVVWVGEDAAGVRGIFGQRFGVGGCPITAPSCATSFGPLGGEFHVASLRGGASHFNRLSIGSRLSSTGEFVVAWNDLANATSADDWIFARRFDALGLPVGSEILVNDVSSTFYRPAVRMSAAGNFVVAWEGGNDGSFFGIHAREFITSVDTTPPVIMPTIAGTLGANGWYTSDVTVDWSVVDPETAITSQTGCGQSSVTSDTHGVTFICTATSAGGTDSKSVTIKRDASSPSAHLAVTAGTPGNNGWFTSDVTVETSGSDNVSYPPACTGPQTVATETAGQVVLGACTNLAGLTTDATPITIKLDKSAPAIAVSSPVEGARYARNQAVAADYACTDGTSGVASCVGTVANGSNIDTTSVGTKTFSVSAIDAAGNPFSRSVTYHVGCRYLTFGLSPSTVARGGVVHLNAGLTSCASTTQFIALRFTLTPQSPGCGGARTFTTPPFPLPANRSWSATLPLQIPAWFCPGAYSIRVDAVIGPGTVVDTATATLTVL